MKKEQLLSLLRSEDGEWQASLVDDAALILANREAAEEQDRLWEEGESVPGSGIERPAT